MEENNKVQSPVIDEICKREKISLIIWLVVVAYQIITGLFWGNFEWLLIAAVNAFACFSNYKFINKIKVNPVGVYKHYKDSLISSIIYIVLNLTIGGFVGVAGAIYDIIIRKYVMDHGEELLELEAQYAD